jgi:hypothetical protein
MSGFPEDSLGEYQDPYADVCFFFPQIHCKKGAGRIDPGADTTSKTSSNVFATFGVPRDPGATSLVG